LLGTGVKLGA